MSTSTQQQVLPRETTEEWQPRPAVREAMQRIATIAIDDPTAVITDTSMTFQNMGERTTISVQPMNLDTWDGARIAEIVTIHTPLTKFKMFDENDYAFVNLFATTGAIVRQADGADALVTRLALYEGDDSALADIYTSLIANGARLQPIGPMSGCYHFQGRGEEYGAAEVGLPDWDEPSFWGSREFANAECRLRAQGLCANAGDTGLTVEFPWDDGAVSAMLGERTSLLRIKSDVPHPAAGNGLFIELSLPVSFTHEEASQAAAKLNRAEAAAIDTPPFIGAWCTMENSGTLSFRAFWPNLLYHPGTVTNLAFWSWARSRFARQMLANSH